jgi:nucleotide-binding universal stress UspA family protein
MAIFKKILCPTDFSAGSDYLLNTVLKLAPGGGAEVCLLHVEPDTLGMIISGRLSAEEIALQRANAVRNLCALVDERRHTKTRINTLLRQGDAAQEITRAAREQQADLIVLSTGGAPDQGLGVVTETVVLNASCPVLIINTPE